MGVEFIPTANGLIFRTVPDHSIEISNVIFNDPATVVFWSDGTKTVVKCQPGDVYSKETGLALCIAKKFLGNKGNFNEVFKKWIPEESKDEDTSEIKVGDVVKIVRYGQTYSRYSDWVKRNVKKKEDVAKWVSGALAKDGEIGVVKYLAPHERAYAGNIAYVEINGRCYMVHVDGLVKV